MQFDCAYCRKSGRECKGKWSERSATGKKEDLSGLDLRGFCMYGAKLRRVCLRDADLSGACLKGADLRKADLRGARIAHTDLQFTELYGAVFDSDCDWSGVNLHYAVMPSTKRLAARLAGALSRRRTC